MSPETDYTWICGVLHDLSGNDLVGPPDWVRNRAHRIFNRPIVPCLVERIRAALVFDSRQPAVSHWGVRSAAVVEGPWQLLYRGGDVDIDLLVRPNQDGRTTSVRGQALTVSGENIDAGVVEALRAEPPSFSERPMPPARSELEPTGEFALANLERGRYDVLVRLGAREIELSGVEL